MGLVGKKKGGKHTRTGEKGLIFILTSEFRTKKARKSTIVGKF